MASAPKLASCSTTPADWFAVRVETEIYLFVVKAHRGAPWREMEVFTQAELLASQQGSVFFDLDARKVEILDQTFRFTSGVQVGPSVVRFYWNPGGSDEIRRLDYDVLTGQLGQPAAEAFGGLDPFVVDGRPRIRAQPGTWTWQGSSIVLATDTSGLANGVNDRIRLDSDGQFFPIQSIDPNVSVTLEPTALTIPIGTGPTSATFTELGNQRLYLVYAKDDGSCAVRKSEDLGASWSDETVFDPPGSGVELVEAQPNDPLQNVLDFQVLQRRA